MVGKAETATKNNLKVGKHNHNKMNIKGFYFLLLTITILFSCSSNNDEPTAISDQPNLTNKWFIDKWTYNGTNQTLTTCDKQGYIQFNINGTFERKDYYWNGTTCTLKGNVTGT